MTNTELFECAGCGTESSVEEAVQERSEGNDRWFCLTCLSSYTRQGFIWCQGCDSFHGLPAHCADCAEPAELSFEAEVMEERPWFCERCRTRIFNTQFDMIIKGLGT
jgi:hypothetical protein